MKLFLQPYANVMLYLGGPMLLSSAVLWFVYLRYLVYLGVLAMLLFFFRCYLLYKREKTVASGWTLYMTHI